MSTPLFEVEELLDEAVAQTGLKDFGPAHFREGLEVLVHSLTNDSHLKPEVVPRARAGLVRLLARRLQVQDWIATHPEVLDERIEKPVCIVGSPRSGSSIMHELWSLDPQTRNPLSWEVNNPVPPPEAATYHTDPRIEAMRAGAGMPAPDPNRRVPHRGGPTLPSEDVEILQLDFATIIPQVSYYVPSYTRWLFEEADYEPMYGTLRRFLQLLQSRCPGSPWVLKTLYSMHWMDAFLEAFPDARVIWLHRDPLTATASGCSLVQMAAGGSSDVVTKEQLAEDVARWSVVRHDLSVDVRERGLLQPDQVIDVKFHEFVQDHVTTVKRIYDFFGLTLKPEVEQTMRDYIAANPAESMRHDYDWESIGLDPAVYRRKFARYQEYFGIPNDEDL